MSNKAPRTFSKKMLMQALLPSHKDPRYRRRMFYQLFMTDSFITDKLKITVAEFKKLKTIPYQIADIIITEFKLDADDFDFTI